MTGQNIHRVSLKFWQRRIVVMGWITYASYYLGRVNLSTAIPDLREGLHLSSQDVGLLSSGFFLSYALGQLISGHLGDLCYLLRSCSYQGPEKPPVCDYNHHRPYLAEIVLPVAPWG